MSDRLEFLQGVAKLHAFYTEQVRMLAHAFGLEDTEAATLLDQYGYYNVARSILNPPQVQMADHAQSPDRDSGTGPGGTSASPGTAGASPTDPDAWSPHG